jgi:hypothetical protein
MNVNTKLDELSLTQFSELPDYNQASELTRHYSLERRGLMGNAPETTKLINIKVEKDKNYVTFYFLTEATEKYGPDYDYKDADPQKHFQLERDPSKLYEIQLRFYNYDKLLKQPQLTQVVAKQWLWSTDFAIWSNSPSFHWQGFNYNLSVLGAAIHPTDIAPHTWNKYHGNALIDKHLFDLFIHIKFFINQMSSSLLNATRVGKRSHKKININPPAGKPPVGYGSNDPLTVPEAPLKQTTVQPEPEPTEDQTIQASEPTVTNVNPLKPNVEPPVESNELKSEPNIESNTKLNDNDNDDDLLPEPTMENKDTILKSKILELNSKFMNILNEIEPQHYLDEIWVDFDNSNVSLYLSSTLEHKYEEPSEIINWTREQVRDMDIDDMTRLIFRSINAGPKRKQDYTPAISKACLVIKKLYAYSQDYKGIFNPTQFDFRNPDSVCLRIRVYPVAAHNNIKANYAGQIVYVNKQRLKTAKVVESLNLDKSLKLQWDSNALGSSFKFISNNKEYKIYTDFNSDFAADSIMDYDQNKDIFKYNFNVDLDWKARKHIYDIFSKCHNINIEFDFDINITSEIIYNTITKGIVQFMNSPNNQNIDLISFECNLKSSGMASLCNKISEYLIQIFDYNYILVLGTSKLGNKAIFILVSDNVYSDTFGSFTIEESKLHTMIFKEADNNIKNNNLNQSKEQQINNDSKENHNKPDDKPNTKLDNNKPDKPERPDKKIVCALSIFNPPTSQHKILLQKVLASASKLHANNLVYIQLDEGYNKDIISSQQKAYIIKSLVKGINVEIRNPVHSLYEVLIDLYNRDYTKVYLLSGSDQIKKYQEIIDNNNGIKTDLGYFKFKECVVASYGFINPDKSNEAIKARNAVANNNYHDFEISTNISDTINTVQIFKLLRYEFSQSVGI